MRKKNEKLTLRKETVRTLKGGDLGQVGGAMFISYYEACTTAISCGGTCYQGTCLCDPTTTAITCTC